MSEMLDDGEGNESELQKYKSAVERAVHLTVELECDTFIHQMAWKRKTAKNVVDSPVGCDSKVVKEKLSRVPLVSELKPRANRLLHCH